MTSEYQEISSKKLLENAKQMIVSEDIKNAELYLRLMKYSSNSDSMGSKIQSMFYLSNIFKTKKDVNNAIYIATKVIKWKSMVDIKRYTGDAVSTLIHILLNAFEVCLAQNNDIMAGWFLFISKNVAMETVLKDDEINEKIKTNFPKVLSKLNEEFNEQYFELKPKKQNLQKICELWNTFNKSPNFKKGDAVFLVNSKWVDSMIDFNEKFNSLREGGDKLFLANKVCLINYEQSNDEKGIYPGCVNNYTLVRRKMIWFDPDEKMSYTNVFLMKNVQEKKNFYFVDEEIFTKIKFYYKCDDVIQRYCTGENTYDLYLNEISVLFLNEYIRDKCKENLIPKEIQYSEASTLDDLLNKVSRCFVHFAKEAKFEDYDYEYKIFLCEYKKKEIIEMIISYSNINKTYKLDENSIDLNDISDKSSAFKSLLPDPSKKYIIIVEAISTNSLVVPFLKRALSTDIRCSLCNFQITDASKIIRCPHCTQSIYCSTGCRDSDHQHISYHKKIASLYEATLQTEEIKQINITTFLDGKSRHGLVGLKNTSNIDFLISAIQALSHCTDLTKFFLSGNYLTSSGKAKDENSLVCAYTELINLLWVGSNSEVSPNPFKNIFFGMLKDISPQTQIDAFDMVVLILDRLHDELNEIKAKPDVSYYEEQNGESDAQACKRWWKTHTSLNKSIIIDLFQGQNKMKIKCGFCKSVSITFPPYLYLTVPIPDKEEMTKIHFKVFPYDISFKYVDVELFDINKFTSIKDIKKRIKQYKIFSNSKIEAMLFKDCDLVKILEDDVLIYDYIFTRYNFSDEEFTDWEISFIEVPYSEKGELVNIYVTPITFEKEEGYFYSTERPLPLTYSKVFSLNQKLTLKDLMREVFKYYRRSMSDMVKHDNEGNIDDSYYTQFYQNAGDSKFIESEYDKFTEDETNKFDIYYYHNFEKSDSWFFSGHKCEFCQSSKGNYCKNKLSLSTQLKYLSDSLVIKRPIMLLIDLTKYKDTFSNFYTKMFDESDPRMALSEEINIYDCFDMYRKEEKLTKEKDYICPRCSRKIEPYQQIDPFRASPYLIINIGRFKKKFEDLMEMVNNRKNETLVEFPLENLDMSNYFIGEDTSIVYDLSAVICHVGGIKNGKYYSVCKNEKDFYMFNDSEVKKLEKKEEIVNKNAFVLIYKMRATDKKKRNEDDVIDTSMSVNAVRDFGEMKNI